MECLFACAMRGGTFILGVWKGHVYGLAEWTEERILG
jgi:hypothetical protein